MTHDKLRRARALELEIDRLEKSKQALEYALKQDTKNKSPWGSVVKIVKAVWNGEGEKTLVELWADPLIDVRFPANRDLMEKLYNHVAALLMDAQSEFDTL